MYNFNLITFNTSHYVGFECSYSAYELFLCLVTRKVFRKSKENIKIHVNSDVFSRIFHHLKSLEKPKVNLLWLNAVRTLG